jgi:hypothetical protein
MFARAQISIFTIKRHHCCVRVGGGGSPLNRCARLCKAQQGSSRLALACTTLHASGQAGAAAHNSTARNTREKVARAVMTTMLTAGTKSCWRVLARARPASAAQPESFFFFLKKT